MDEPLFIIIGVSFIVLILMLPRLLRNRNDKDERRELQKALQERGRAAVLMEFEEKISDQLAHIARLESNAGVIFGGEEDGALQMEHRKLRRLYQSRDIVTDYREGRH